MASANRAISIARNRISSRSMRGSSIRGSSIRLHRRLRQESGVDGAPQRVAQRLVRLVDGRRREPGATAVVGPQRPAHLSVGGFPRPALRTGRVVALLVAAAGFIAQMIAGVTDTSTIPPGLVAIVAALTSSEHGSWSSA
jgi:hypothetical protein